MLASVGIIILTDVTAESEAGRPAPALLVIYREVRRRRD